MTAADGQRASAQGPGQERASVRGRASPVLGAAGRLLPASIPLRFFGAAVLFHLLAWLALGAGAGQWPAYPSAMGWPLAALHLLTLGVLGMSAIGASAQLLPVATRQAAPSQRLLGALWWLYSAGVALLALGMGLVRPALLGAGALALVLGLLLWAGLIARNLRGARGMRAVVAHGWLALAALALLLASALALAASWNGLPTLSRNAMLALHLAFGPYGFMGLLSLGLSYILVPMFAVSDVPGERAQLASAGLILAALVLAALAAIGLAPMLLRVAALLLAAAGVGLHLHLMTSTLRSGMRRALGRSFTLVRIGWSGLAASLALALGLVLQVPIPRLGSWFGLCLIGVWLLSFLLGMLQRILPFLAAMHASHGQRARTPSALTHEGALRVHFVCHLVALALLGLAIGTDSAVVVTAASVVGSAGALAFGVFYGVVLYRLRRPA